MNRLNLFRFGVAFGLMLGVALLVVGIVAWLTGVGGPLVETVASLFRGYGARPFGAVIGGVWGCAVGFPCGAFLAWVYNRLPS